MSEYNVLYRKKISEFCYNSLSSLKERFGKDFFSSIVRLFGAEEDELCQLFSKNRDSLVEFLCFFSISESQFFSKVIDSDLQTWDTFKSLKNIMPKRSKLTTLSIKKVVTNDWKIDQSEIKKNRLNFEKFKNTIIDYNLQYMQTPIAKYKFVIYHLLQIETWNKLRIESRARNPQKSLQYILDLLVERLKEVNIIVNFVTACCTHIIENTKLELADEYTHVQSVAVWQPDYFLLNICDQNETEIKIYSILHELVHIICEFENSTIHQKPEYTPRSLKTTIIECNHVMAYHIALIVEHILLENIPIRTINRFSRVPNSIAITSINHNVSYRLVLKRFIKLHPNFNWNGLGSISKRIEELINTKTQKLQEDKEKTL